MASNQTISSALKMIKAAYPRFDLAEKETILVWAGFLQDINDDLLMAAVTRFISSSAHAFAPSIPEIRKEAAELRREILGVPTSFEAWDELISAPSPRPAGAMYRIFRNGQYVDEAPYQFPHEIVGVVARRLGWPIRFPSADNEMADRAHFIKAYEQEMGKVMRLETQVPLVSEYIEQERTALLDDRRAALDTGERAEANRDMRRLAFAMER